MSLINNGTVHGSPPPTKPMSSLDTYKKYTSCAHRISNALTMIGMANRWMVSFGPRKAAIGTTAKFPTKSNNVCA